MCYSGAASQDYWTRNSVSDVLRERDRLTFDQVLTEFGPQEGMGQSNVCTGRERGSLIYRVVAAFEPFLASTPGASHLETLCWQPNHASQRLVRLPIESGFDYTSLLNLRYCHFLKSPWTPSRLVACLSQLTVYLGSVLYIYPPHHFFVICWHGASSNPHLREYTCVRQPRS